MLYPNELGLLDEGTEKVFSTIRLRHGVVTGYGTTPHTPDFRRLYHVTDRMEAVEVVDPEAGQVIEVLRLSTATRRVRILGVIPLTEAPSHSPGRRNRNGHRPLRGR